MKDTENEQFEDDNVEITDIPEEELGASNTPPSPRLPLWLLNRKLSPRQHALQLAITISTIVLVLLIILASSASIRNTIQVGLFGPIPTPTPTLAPGANLFYITGSPFRGQVSIDGHPISHLPNVNLDSSQPTTDPPLQLTRGPHHLLWRANPFLPQSCLLSVPPNFATDTCHLSSTARFGLELISVITFHESLATLPNDQRTTLIQTAQAAIANMQSTETVYTGEQYVDISGNQSTITSTQPLHAILHFQLDTSAESYVPCLQQGTQQVCNFEGQDCHLFCPRPGEQQQLPRLMQAWPVFAVIDASWKYTTLSGQGIASDQPDTSGENINDEHLVALNITKDEAGWHVTIPSTNSSNQTFNDPACASAQDEIGTDGEFGVTGGSIEAMISWRFTTAPNRAAGCLAIGTPQSIITTPPQPPPPTAYLLHRFGILLAANEAAQMYWPFLPVADSYEQHLAQQLANQTTALTPNISLREHSSTLIR